MPQEPDFSNPFVVITAFFSLLVTGLAFLVRFIPAILSAGGILSGVGLLVGGLFVWVKIFSE